MVRPPIRNNHENKKKQKNNEKGRLPDWGYLDQTEKANGGDDQWLPRTSVCKRWKAKGFTEEPFAGDGIARGVGWAEGCQKPVGLWGEEDGGMRR